MSIASRATKIWTKGEGGMLSMRQALRPPAQQPKPHVTRAARMLALAHHIERLIEAEELKDYAAAAKALGLTRARLTQVMNLLLLAAEIQARVLVGEESEPARNLRCLVGVADWSQQVSMADDQAARRMQPPLRP